MELAKLDGNPEFLALARQYEARAAAEPTITRDAEIIPSRSPAWHVLTCGPRRERTAAAHLAGRRFGVYVPEEELTEIRLGRRRTFLKRIFPGYVFIFVWDIDRHRDRIMACPGVSSILRKSDGTAAILPDSLVDKIRAVENANRPLMMTIEEVTINKRKRKSRRTTREVDVDFNEIIGVHAYSAFDRIKELDQAARNSLLLNALGLAS